jgi:hypothetical protein
MKKKECCMVGVPQSGVERCFTQGRSASDLIKGARAYKSRDNPQEMRVEFGLRLRRLPMTRKLFVDLRSSAARHSHQCAARPPNE